MLDDLTPSGYVNQWTIDTDGQAKCLLDPLPLGDVAKLALARNAAVRAVLAQHEQTPVLVLLPLLAEEKDPEAVAVAHASLMTIIEADAAERLASVTLPPGPVPERISDRQFFQGLATTGLILKEEALAAVKTGEIPAALGAFLEDVSEDERFAAHMLLAGATVFERSHPLTIGIAAKAGMSPQELDAFWRMCAAL